MKDKRKDEDDNKSAATSSILSSVPPLDSFEANFLSSFAFQAQNNPNFQMDMQKNMM